MKIKTHKADHQHSSRFRKVVAGGSRIFASIICLMGATLAAHAQTSTSATPTITYPRINTSVWYEVDPNWPQRPPDVEWGHVPGVAVDRHDNVWIHTRA
ncbi:hypothetical protein FJY63_09960, partial [Candidatus Sumerlaeota bacterium]|nr:hypothetical protein [Candidatus Sumerlaeota bacterium]